MSSPATIVSVAGYPYQSRYIQADNRKIRQEPNTVFSGAQQQIQRIANRKLSVLFMRKLFSVLCILFLAYSTRSQVIVHFTPNGAGNRNGSSWTNAMPGTQLAPILQLYLADVEIWVAAGTYKAHASSRDSSFFINSSLKVYGGFNGTETHINQRDWQANPTILSGDIGVQGNNADNSYHVVKFQNADSTTVLDGFIIEDGNANIADSYWSNMGGGIYSSAFGILGRDYGSPMVRNCIIRNNYADWGGGGIADFAGGVRAGIRVENCIFEDNISGSGGRGGAGFLSFSFAGDGPLSPSLYNCTFRNNKAQTGAGAITQAANFDNSATIYINNCIFEHNMGINAGAISFSSTTDPYNPDSHTAVFKSYISNCRFTDNTGTGSGTSAVIGASYYSGNPADGHELLLNNCQIDNNTCWNAPVNIWAGGYSYRTKNVIENCIFQHNITQYAGGINIDSRSGNTDSTFVNNCLFHHTGKRGIFNAIANDGGHVRSFINNITAYTDSSRFGTTAMFTNSAVNNPGASMNPCSAYMYVNNSILWHYRFSYLTSGVFALSNIQYGSNATARTTTTNSIINLDNNTWPAPAVGSGLPDYGTNGGGNIGVYPRFRDTAAFDFHLACGSRAIDAGSNVLIPQNITQDLDGNDRIQNSIVDMGCFESGILPDPLALPSVTVNNMTVTCTAGFNIQADSVRWTFGDGQSSNQLNPVHTFASNGVYTVCLRIYTTCGEDEKCETVTISSTGLPAFADAMENVAVYPNPANNTVYISGLSPQADIQLLSISGSVLKTWNFIDTKAGLDLSGLAAGVYILDITATRGHKILRIVKE